MTCGALIGGNWITEAETWFDVHDPATLHRIAKVPDFGVNAATAAVDAAAAAFPTWKGIPPRERADMLLRMFQLMVRNIDQLSKLISSENGKSLSDARAEVDYAAEFFRWYSEEAVRTSGTYGEAPAGGARTIVTHHPIGVAALITPWNFPAAMTTRKIAPALAAGCTVVLKPAAETPLTALAIAELTIEAGIPNGVINVVPTANPAEVVGTWLDDQRVRLISFTGSTNVGRLMLRQAAERVIVSSMELGGNAPFVICEDADIPAAVEGAMTAKLRGGGQACTAANRFYVHDDVADEFTEAIGARIEKLRVGAAADDCEIGPLISAEAAQTIESKIEEALRQGARITHQAANVVGRAGYFVSPVVLRDVPPESRLVVEETFGPVTPIVTWQNEQNLLNQINASELGLAAYVYSRDLQRAISIAESIEAGMVGINRGAISDPSAPFGGMKQSGLGREGARDGLKEFQETQYLSINWLGA